MVFENVAFLSNSDLDIIWDIDGGAGRLIPAIVCIVYTASARLWGPFAIRNISVGKIHWYGHKTKTLFNQDTIAQWVNMYNKMKASMCIAEHLTNVHPEACQIMLYW